MSVDQSLLVLGRYLPETILGEGAYGTVYKAVDIVSNKYVAIKYQSKVVLTEKDLYYSRREAQVLKKLDHPNIVKLIESFEDDTAFILVMEMAEGGDLLEYANQKGGCTETEARQIFVQLLSAISYTHSQGIIHRDLKLENILLDVERRHIYIADWGFAGDWTTGKMQKEPLGSVHYCAPQVIKNQLYIGPELDCWSLGVVLFVLVSGRLPFSGNNCREIQEAIIQGKYRVPSRLTAECTSLLKSMICVDSWRRIPFDKITEHPWTKPRRFSSPLPVAPEDLRSPVMWKRVEEHRCRRAENAFELSCCTTIRDAQDKPDEPCCSDYLRSV